MAEGLDRRVWVNSMVAALKAVSAVDNLHGEARSGLTASQLIQVSYSTAMELQAQPDESVLRVEIQGLLAACGTDCFQLLRGLSLQLR